MFSTDVNRKSIYIIEAIIRFPSEMRSPIYTAQIFCANNPLFFHIIANRHIFATLDPAAAPTNALNRHPPLHYSSTSMRSIKHATPREKKHKANRQPPDACTHKHVHSWPRAKQIHRFFLAGGKRAHGKTIIHAEASETKHDFLRRGGVQMEKP